MTHTTSSSPRLTRRSTLGLIGAGSAALALPAAARAAPVAPAEANALLDAMAWRLLELGPEGVTGLGLDVGERAGFRARWGDSSAKGHAARASLLRSELGRIAALDMSGLDAVTRTHFAVVKSAYSTALDGFAQPYGDVAIGSYRNAPYVVCQNVGTYIDVPQFLDSSHPVHNASDAEAYLARLGGFAEQLDGELGRLKAAHAMGVVAPDFVLDKTIVQLGRTLAGAQQGGSLVTSLTRRTKDIPGDWDRRARAIVAERVVPALARQLAEIERVRPQALHAAGISARPHGEEWYRWALRAGTTTHLTPEEVHAIGQEQLKLLQGRMEPILQSLGYTKGTVGERMQAIGRDPRFMFPESDEGRAQIVDFIHQRLDKIRAKLPLAFRRLTKGNVEVKRMSPESEPGAPGAYGGPGSLDGSIPGRMWINLRTTALHSKYSLPTLVHHEAIPGHVWQGEYSQRMPLMRTLLEFNPYTEGWALYAETLADELGDFDGDPVGQLGYLQSIAFRACRLVIDTGLHNRGWSREQAIDWFMATNGSGREEVTSEVERYCTWPGQACGYKIGHSEILRQREKAKAALGARYDLRDFDMAVLEGGNVPLDVLGQNIDRYIAGAKG